MVLTHLRVGDDDVGVQIERDKMLRQLNPLSKPVSHVIGVDSLHVLIIPVVSDCDKNACWCRDHLCDR